MAPLPVQDIQLTEKDKEVFGILLATLKHAQLNTTLRAAGGWVRDKLLGRDSEDIDIALDNMMGLEFATRVQDYLRSQGMENHAPHEIAANPEQSKHLNTSTMKVAGLDLDFVNLRSETYTQHSRIPQIDIGTPEQDALRRDFTINSLFYNLNEGAVEDFTRLGMDDLRSGIIRTPMDPKTTFLDDPLRVLRGVRFASRFGFEMAEDVLKAGSDPEVLEALDQKISRERIGKEMELMYNGANPPHSLSLLHTLKLFPVVFHPPNDAIQEAAGPSYGPNAHTCVSAAWDLQQAFQAQQSEEAGEASNGLQNGSDGGPSSCSPSSWSLDARRLYLVAATLLQLRGSCFQRGTQQIGACSAIIREKLKWKKDDSVVVQKLIDSAGTFFLLWDGLKSSGNTPTPSLRLQAGHAIRQLGSAWPLAIVLAPLVTLPEAEPRAGVGGAGCSIDSECLGQEQAAVERWKAAASGAGEEQDRWLAVVRDLNAAIGAFGLERCYEWKPLVNGREVMQLTGAKGPQVGQYMDLLLKQRLQNPEMTQIQAREFLQTQTVKSNS